ncbi:nuclear transport factor 2 domain protein [Aspergillus flavus AF70]|nr:nuclear transport factor 2 domain protein [Aspergillus flavus AF70]
MSDDESIARSFVSHYYGLFDNTNTRSTLTSLYRPESNLVWEGQPYQGPENIMAALSQSGLDAVKTKVTTIDPVPTSNSGVLVVATGALVAGDAYDKPLKFSSTFLLQPIPGQASGYFIEGQIFRLAFD